MLALEALREKKPEIARIQLSELIAEFPENPLFARSCCTTQFRPNGITNLAGLCNAL
jgi:predicted Zn-dependent protease